MDRGFIAVVLLVAASCGYSESPVNRTIEVDSAEVQILTTEGPDHELPATIRPLFELGGDPSGPESFYQLYPLQVGIGQDSRIAILDRQANQVQVFGDDGTHLATLGGSGQGPGEFTYPTAVFLRPDGEVAVHAFQKGGFVRFASGGAILEEERLGVPFNGASPIIATDSGILLVSQETARDEGIRTWRLLHLSDTDTSQLGSNVEARTTSVNYASCGVSMTQTPLFSAPLIWASNGRQTAVTAGPAYSILIFDGTKRLRILRRPLEPKVVTEAILAEEIGEGESWDIGGRECVVPRAEVVEERGHADVVPVIENLAVTPSGQLWVKRRAISQEAPGIDVFSSDGRYIGTLPPEVPFPVRFLPDGRMAVIETDSLDVQRLVVYDVDIVGS